MSVIFYIVRHGETLLNQLGKAQGWCDSPLTNEGNKMALELGERLEGTFFKEAYSSDTIRATKTAEQILSASGNTNLQVQQDERLREWCLGTMEGEEQAAFVQTVAKWLGGVSSFAELNKRLSDVASAIYEHDTTGMAEPFPQILERLKDALMDIVKKYPNDEDENILLVTHAFVIKTLFYIFEPDRLFIANKVKNTEIFKLKYHQGDFKFLFNEY